jgi:hypothetical protein
VLQLATTHVPPLQAEVAFGRLQTCPQVPQLEVVFRLVSHPLFGLLSQLAKPALQTGWQTPLAQLVVPCALVQVLPHVPQLLMLLVMFVSQPVEYCPSQLANPALQVATWQVPLTQVAVPLATEHLLPQNPQLLRLFVMFVSQPLAYWPSQLAKPVLQVAIRHTPPLHATVALATC